MTNSAPKMSDKVERQGSPNASGKQRQHHRSGTIKTTTYFASGGRNSARNGATNGGRLSCSPPTTTTTTTTPTTAAAAAATATKNLRNSPLRCNPENATSPRGSPTGGFYAGAKFSEPPSPASLPKPPSHWTTRLMSSCQQSETCCSISNHLKMILNVQA